MKKVMLLSSVALATTTYANPKYTFLFIGDGMGLAQVGATEIFLSSKDGETPNITKSLTFTQFPTQGIITTHDTTSFIPDSASTGTAMATGYKTADGIIAMDPSQKVAYKSIAKYAKESGRKVGIISSVSINHATPAVFYANQPSRGEMYEIAYQLANSNIDYIGGGTASDADGKKAKEAKGNVFEVAKKNNYTITKTVEEFKALKPPYSKVWAVTEHPADGDSLGYKLDRGENELSLADFTKKGIEVLSTNNSKGFFMMVEGGKIDWAAHANDARSVIGEVIDFNDAVKVALEFANKNPKDTLIVVVGDHETGGLSIGSAMSKYKSSLHILNNQTVSYVKFDSILTTWIKENKDVNFAELLKLTEKYFGLSKEATVKELQLTEFEIKRLETAFLNATGKSNTKSEEYYKQYGSYNPVTVTLTSILNEKAGIGWSTWSHSATPVPIYAFGSKHETFNGFYDNTLVFKKLKDAMGLK